MDDFLHRLRTGKDKRFDRNKRNYEPSQYRPMDRQNGNERRKKSGYKQQGSDQGHTAIVKVLPTLKTLLENIAEDLRQITKLEDRKTIAVEAIAVYLKKLSGYEGALAAGPVDVEAEEIPTNSAPDAEEAATEKDENDFEKTLQLIKKLREEEGLSFEKIAQQLDASEISTPSGRGKWRGQAVSKLYK
jgi:histone H3/H4